MVNQARIAQLVEHRTENPGVRSSILRPGIFFLDIYIKFNTITIHEPGSADYCY